MTLKIVGGRLHGGRFVAANSAGGAMLPTLIVLHDTAGSLNAGSSVAWFASEKCKTSAHFVVERDGSITQMVATDRKAFHAGESTFKGRRFCNGFAVGIEIVSPGKCDADGKAWFGKATDEALVRMKTKSHGDGYWLPYTAAQIDAVTQLCRALISAHPAIKDITTHWFISPGRKIDPSPVFPLEDVRARAFAEKVEPPQPQSVQPAPPVAAADPAWTATVVPVVAAAGAPTAPPVAQRSPVAFPGAFASMAWTTTVERDLGAVSRKVSIIGRVRKFLHTVWATIFGLFTLENLGVARSWIDGLKDFAGDNVALLGIVSALAGIALLTYLLSLIGDDADKGNYVPSGVTPFSVPPR